MPKSLRPGCTIGICAPAGPVKPDRMQRAVAGLREAGFNTILSKSALEQDGLFSAKDAVRRTELEELFVRDDIDAVFCARGGVGSSRLLTELDTGLIARHRKPFLGFSDITAIQWLLWQRQGFVTYSGPLAVEWDGAVTRQTMDQALHVMKCPDDSDLLGPLPSADLSVLRSGSSSRVAGQLLAGNLTMITTLAGTPYLPDLKGAVLLIEDINEPPHRVDRMLFHLRNAGLLNSLAALLVGDFWSDPTAEDTAMLHQSLVDSSHGYEYPIVTGFPYGHGATRMTVPIGMTVNLDLRRLSLRTTRIQTSAVS